MGDVIEFTTRKDKEATEVDSFVLEFTEYSDDTCRTRLSGLKDGPHHAAEMLLVAYRLIMKDLSELDDDDNLDLLASVQIFSNSRVKCFFNNSIDNEERVEWTRRRFEDAMEFCEEVLEESPTIN